MNAKWIRKKIHCALVCWLFVCVSVFADEKRPEIAPAPAQALKSESQALFDEGLYVYLWREMVWGSPVVLYHYQFCLVSDKKTVGDTLELVKNMDPGFLRKFLAKIDSKSEEMRASGKTANDTNPRKKGEVLQLLLMQCEIAKSQATPIPPVRISSLFFGGQGQGEDCSKGELTLGAIRLYEISYPSHDKVKISLTNETLPDEFKKYCEYAVSSPLQFPIGEFSIMTIEQAFSAKIPPLIANDLPSVYLKKEHPVMTRYYRFDRGAGLIGWFNDLHKGDLEPYFLYNVSQQVLVYTPFKEFVQREFIQIVNGDVYAHILPHK